ncbi:carbon monoxide dehydrogenase [Jannaschia pagri]|uniref:Carbon monoxide dehydrogenase n=1 Tax=Jannaschia pagri TaxID=2829797 RepID=A0ABQ4NJH5_9RHOB|nr:MULTISPECIES: carbon monoxide dehydrogenase subunit G [unclassified Jannaschia]GIT89543.1 carbon monoxide dehydrogenase [Jannaschia sp. AI_61]GIT94349.1 carbon monoxide dehydrogenase [Jannaschia sp. AI_62]
MEMTGTRTIAAPPQQVWDALLNAETLKACVPGCTEMAGNADEGFTATVVQKVGPVKATFKGAVTLSDRKPVESLTLTGEGKGGAAGFAKGGANVTLTPVAGGTELSYEVDARVGGKLAQLGSRIVDAFAAKMADQFFERFQQEVAPEGAAEPEAVAAAPAAVEPAPDPVETPKKKGWFRRLLAAD